MSTSTFDAVREIIARDYDLPGDSLDRDTPLTDLKIDSLALVELIFTLEERFGVQADNMPADLPTLGSVADYVDALIAARGVAASPAQ